MGGKHSKRRHKIEDPPWYYGNWPVVDSCYLKKWRKYRATACGFHPLINYANYKEVRFQPAATFGRLLHAELIYPYDLACRYNIYIDEANQHSVEMPRFLQNLMHLQRVLTVEDMNWMPKAVEEHKSLKLTGLLNENLLEEGGHGAVPGKVNVIASYNDHIVLQVIRASGANKIVLAREEEHTYCVLSVFTVETEDDNPYLMEAIISPDYSSIIIKASWGFSRKYRFDPEKNDVCLYDAKDQSSSLPEPRVLVPFNGMNWVIAFDPRYGNSRIACGNRQASHTGSDVIRVYDLSGNGDLSEPIGSSAVGGLQTTQNLAFSPDGRFIASLASTVDRKWLFQVKAILVYNSDTLGIFHAVDIPWANTDSVEPMPSTVFPLFSMNGRYLAYYRETVNDDGGETVVPSQVTVLAVPVDINLQNLCRLTLRRHLNPASVLRLPLPNKLKHYLQYRPFM